MAVHVLRAPLLYFHFYFYSVFYIKPKHMDYFFYLIFYAPVVQLPGESNFREVSGQSAWSCTVHTGLWALKSMNNLQSVQSLNTAHQRWYWETEFLLYFLFTSLQWHVIHPFTTKTEEISNSLTTIFNLKVSISCYLYVRHSSNFQERWDVGCEVIVWGVTYVLGRTTHVI